LGCLIAVKNVLDARAKRRVKPVATVASPQRASA